MTIEDAPNTEAFLRDSSEYVRWALHHDRDPKAIEHEFDAALRASADLAWHQAVHRVWEAFMDRDWDDPSISPKELHKVLEAVLEEDRDPAA